MNHDQAINGRGEEIVAESEGKKVLEESKEEKERRIKIETAKSRFLTEVNDTLENTLIPHLMRAGNPQKDIDEYILAVKLLSTALRSMPINNFPEKIGEVLRGILAALVTNPKGLLILPEIADVVCTGKIMSVPLEPK